VHYIGFQITNQLNSQAEHFKRSKNVLSDQHYLNLTRVNLLVVNLRFNSLIKVSEMEDIDIIDTCEHKYTYFLFINWYIHMTFSHYVVFLILNFNIKCYPQRQY
jgi:hypothetical protein